MQIGCIVHMVPDWNKLQLRLLNLCSPSLSDQVVTLILWSLNLILDLDHWSLTNDHIWPGITLHFLFDILSGGGKGRNSTGWSSSLPKNSSSTSYGKNQSGCSSYCHLLVQVRQSAFMESASDPSERAVQANSLLQSQSSNASILFLYLPAPPNLIHPQYLKSLDILTKGLPPTLLVHAVRSVVTTNL